MASLLSGVCRLGQGLLRGCSGTLAGRSVALPCVKSLSTQTLVTSLTSRFSGCTLLGGRRVALLQPCAAPVAQQPTRTRIRYSRIRGEPVNEDEVTDRFFRLHNGQWIRPRAGRAKRVWRKKARWEAARHDHVCCTHRQCQTLDKMVNRKYKERTFYFEDPYAAYHLRERIPHYSYTPPMFLP